VREVEDEAVVLRTYKSGEADRVVIVWTRHFGKLRVLAKGARKTSSRLGGSLETLAHVNVDLVKTRGEFYVARHVQHYHRLTTLRSSYQRISAGYAVVEVIDAIPSDGVPDEAIFELVVRVLLALDNEQINPELVPASFYLRLLALDGSAPVVDACVNCERRGPLVAFDAATGGALCDQCRRGVALSPAALALLRRVVGGELGAVLREVTPAGSGEVMAIAQESIEVHLGRRFRVAQSSPSVGHLER
jgi:DNA repair protein RecO (recombination protein O)